DLERPASGGSNDERIVAAVRSGDLAEDVLDVAAARVLRMIARAQPTLAEPGTFQAEAHHDLAREVATQAAVLLKNDDGALPLRSERLATEAVLIGVLARPAR